MLVVPDHAANERHGAQSVLASCAVAALKVTMVPLAVVWAEPVQGEGACGMQSRALLHDTPRTWPSHHLMAAAEVRAAHVV